jgi:ubiquinone/menaquinone biosynthesis C-methylase UbiE
MVLTRSQARTFYDRFGKKQDTQAFYEDAALDDLIAHAAFEQVEKVFELGCGTGRFASRLLTNCLSPSASYLGIDLSQTMIAIAEERVLPYKERARVSQSDGSMRFPLPDHSVDCVVSTYVLDLLPETDIRQAISEARRVLIPSGKLCLVSLTHGVTLASRVICELWSTIFRMRPSLVGGCRPILLVSFFNQHSWSIDYRNVVTQFGVPSEVLIASSKNESNNKQIRGNICGKEESIRGYFAKLSYGLMKNESYIYAGVKAQELTKYILSFKMNDTKNILN